MFIYYYLFIAPSPESKLKDQTSYTYVFTSVFNENELDKFLEGDISENFI